MNLKSFHLLFKERVLDVFKQSWCNKIALQNSMVLYKDFKSSIDFEIYLDVLPYKFRISLSRLQLSSQQLNIEVGRHGSNRVDRHRRLCLLCNTTDIEDEFHLVLICPIYLHFRKRHIKPYFYKRPSVHKFIELMQSSNKCIIKNLGKYVYEALALRSSLND